MPFNSYIRPIWPGLAAIVFLQYSGIDLYLSGLVYFPEGQWQFKNHWLLNTVIHRGGRLFIAGLIVSMLLATLFSLFSRHRYHPYRPIIFYLLLATLLSIAAVSMLKQLTTLPCPWDVLALGGGRSNVFLAQLFSSKQQVGHCFPSGHASGGFALFSFYFAGLAINKIKYNKPDRRRDRLWLLPGMVTGIIFGTAQQLRGAHFLSHDIASAAVCWFICGGLAYIMLPTGRPGRGIQNAIRVPTISAD